MITNQAPAAPPRAARAAAWGVRALLALIVALGVYFNTIGLWSWDSGTGQHPDERFMALVASRLHAPSSLAEYLDSQRSPLNPRNVGYPFYVYGLLPQTLVHYTAVALTSNEALVQRVPQAGTGSYESAPLVPNPDLRVPKLTLLHPLLNPGGEDLTAYFTVHRVGRAWSALFAALSVLVVFLIGRRLYGARGGLLAALLLALSVLPIQLAHFFTVDSATAFFTLLSVYWAVRLSQRGGWLNATALGLSIGAAMACRITMASLGLLAALALAQRYWLARAGGARRPQSDVYFTPSRRPSLLGAAALLALAGAVTLVTFRMLQPDAFVGSSILDLRPEPRFIRNIVDISASVSGQFDSPPSQQWTGRTRFVFALQNMIVWGMGLPLGLVAWAAWAMVAGQLARGLWDGWNGRGWGRLAQRLKHIIPWAWVTFYFAWQGGIFGMTMRYYLQLYGLLALLAAWALLRAFEYRLLISDWRPRRSAWYRLQAGVRWVPLLVVVVGTLAWAYAFTRIYTRPHSRVTASRWMYEHIPAGKAVTAELWDDPLPLAIDDRYPFDTLAGGWYRSVMTYPYAEDDPEKYTGQIKLDGSFEPGLLDQLTQADYVVLASNRVYGSATRMPMRYPALTRYYHTLFSGELGFDLVADISSYPTLFGVAIPDQGAEEAFSVYDHPRVLIFQKTPRFSRALAEHLITGDVAWGEVYKLTSLRASGVPTALRLTDAEWPRYRDLASTFAERFDPAGLVALAPWLFWLLALELLGLAAWPLLFRLLPGLPDRGFALAKPLGLLLASYAAWLLGSLRIVPFGPGSAWLCAGLLAALGGWLAWRGRGRLWAFARERRRALLSAELLFLAAYGAFVLIRALNPDLWHEARAGEKPLDLALLTATLKSPAFPPYDPWFAGGFLNMTYFGYVLAGLPAQLTGLAPTTAYNLAIPTLFALTALGAWGVAYNLFGSAGEAGPRERRATRTGLAAAAAVALLGPLTQASWLLPGTATPPFAGLPPQCQVSSYVAQQICRGRAEWAYWDAPRLVGMRLGDTTVHEFPFFSFLFADLRPHLIALPLALLVLGLLVALARAELPGHGGRWQAGAALGLLALGLGALRATDSWAFAVFMALACVTLGVLAVRQAQRGAHALHTLLAWVGVALGLLFGSALLFRPFLSRYASGYAGLQLWSGAHTTTGELLQMHGLWLFLLVSGAVLLYWRRGAGLPLLAVLSAGPLLIGTIAALAGLSSLFLLVPLACGALAILIDFTLELDEQEPPAGQDSSEPYLQLRLPAFERLADEPPPFASTARLLAISWALAGLILALLPEVAVARGDIGRVGTVLELGTQSWLLLALASAVALGAVWPALRARPRAVLASALGYGWRALAALLVAAALFYPLSATPARLADRIDRAGAPTLDGAAALVAAQAGATVNSQRFDLAEDAAAIGWLRAHVPGNPIVLEGQAGSLGWGGRVAAYTGLPTLLGWPFPASQQRAPAGVAVVLDARQDLIEQLYGADDMPDALRQLQLYGVEYVVVGKLERARYPAAGLAKFERMAQERQIEQVYSAGSTQIYRVPRAPNPPAVVSTTLATTPPHLAMPKGTSLDAPVHTLAAVGEYAWNPLARSEPVALLLWLLACYALLALGLPVSVLIFGQIGQQSRGLAQTLVPNPDEGPATNDQAPASRELVLGPSSFVTKSTDSTGRGVGGFAWARLVGLLLLGYAVWLPVSMRLWSYNRWSLLWGALLVLALDAAALVLLGRAAEGPIEKPAYHEDTKTPRYRMVSTFNAWGLGDLVVISRIARGMGLLGAYLRAQRRGVVVAEALWLAGFGCMALLRAFNPDLWQPYWGGEKPFEFGFLNAILRSPVMPPYDPFFSGGAINYYYYGLFLASLPIKATGIAPAVGFNLVIATLLALTLVGAFAVVARLTGRLRYGLVGGVFVALLGNLAAAFPVGWGAGLAPVLQALEPGLGGFAQRLGSWFVGPSRVIVIPDKLITINEFPFWSYLFADLHPHLIAMPIATLVVALAFELFELPKRRDEGPRTKDQGFQQSARLPRASAVASSFVVRLLSAVLLALALGALAVTNSWDLPTYALLIGGALLGRAYRVGMAGGLLRALLLAGAQAGAVVGGALLLYLPFFQNYVRPAGVTGLGSVRDGSPIGPFLLIYGLYLLILGMWVGGLAARLLRPRRAAASQPAPEPPGRSQSALGMVARPPSAGWLTRANALMLAFGLIALVLLTSQSGIGLIRAGLAAAWASPGLLKLGLLALLAAGAPALLARRLPGRIWFTLWMAVLAWAVSFGVELVYIRDHLDGGDGYRMNTVFKFGLQAWMLMALAAAAALPWLGRGLARAGARAQKLSWAALAVLLALALLPVFSALTAGGLQLWMLIVLLAAGGMLWLGHMLRRSGGLAQVLAWALIAALVGLALVYPIVGIPSRLAYRFPKAPGPTLDGLAFMEQAEFDLLPEYMGKPSGETVTISLKDDLDAIVWLNEHVAGSPVVLQSDLWFYRTYGVRVAANTGLPTIVSPLHASEQHDPKAVADRDLDAQEIYYTLDQRVALKLLARYRVGYIYIGQIERAAYGAAGLAKFERMNGPYLRRVYRNPTVTIYQVNPTTFRQPWDEPAGADQGPAGESSSGGETALAQLEREVAQDPGALGPLFRLAQRYRELRRLSDAVDVVREAVQERPRDVALRHLLGDLLRDDGRADEAEREYRAALAAEPTAGNWNKLGAELLKWGRLADAADALGQAVTVDPTAAEPHYHLGVLYERQGDRAQAIKEYRAYLALALPSASYYPAARAALDRLE